MFTIFAALIETSGVFIFWAIFGIPVLWALYMMTFRTDDWLRLRKEEQERKAKTPGTNGQGRQRGPSVWPSGG